MRLSSMSFILLLAPLSLSAQYGPGQSSPHRVELRAAAACPVGFSVNHRPDGAVLWTSSTPAPHGPGLSITFGRPAKLAQLPSAIVSASITVHGISARVRAVPIASSASPADDATETFSLGGNSGQPLLNSAIWTRNMSAISWVELTQLVYADGITWQSSTPRQCSAALSLYVPVAASARP